MKRAKLNNIMAYKQERTRKITKMLLRSRNASIDGRNNLFKDRNRAIITLQSV